MRYKAEACFHTFQPKHSNTWGRCWGGYVTIGNCCLVGTRHLNLHCILPISRKLNKVSWVDTIVSEQVWPWIRSRILFSEVWTVCCGHEHCITLICNKWCRRKKEASSTHQRRYQVRAGAAQSCRVWPRQWHWLWSQGYALGWPLRRSPQGCLTNKKSKLVSS